MEAEGIEEGQQEKKADHTKNNDNQDGVHLHVQLLPWEQCGGGQEGRWSSIETGLRSHCGKVWLHRHQVGNFWHDGRMCSLSGLGILCCTLKAKATFHFGLPQVG